MLHWIKIALVLLCAILTLSLSADEHNTEENYFKYCSGCHGEDGEPVKNGVTDLREPRHKRRAGREGFIRVISEGRGRMPAFEKRLSQAEIEALAEYAMRLSN